MPLQNRVLPTGEIVAHPSKAGLFMGNRGILHGEAQTLLKRRWAHKSWIICLLGFKDRQRTMMTKGAYTELFFLDEAVAVAAGHRPCGECRNAAYRAYRKAFPWADEKPAKAAEIDRTLHLARFHPHSRDKLVYGAPAEHLPDGVFIRLEGDTWLVLGDRLLRFTPNGYDAYRDRPKGLAPVLTPLPSVVALRNGYKPILHPSSRMLLD